ncbi:hypothetical protein ACN4EE_04805 [Geminocystis sp. CENA526]|uniref:hypothetical protein n=1 Tax=Geminocystis sp. CENA526 TaxID=1355871 RepID=UPI003D6E634C
MAALEVVQRRLDGIGLGNFCLELHSSDVNRKQVVESLMASFNQQRLSKVDASELLADLEEIKRKLADYPIALHEKQSLGLSMYEIMGELEGLETISTVSLPSSVVEEITPSKFKEMNQALENYALRVELVEPITEHLWRFSNCADWSLSLELEITNLLNQLRNNASELEEKLSLWLENISNQNSNSVLQNQWKPSWNIIRQIPLLGEIINSNLPECVYEQNNWTKSSEIAKEWLNASRDSFERKQQISQRWQDSIYGLDLVAKIKTFEKLERIFPLFRWFMQIIPRFSLRSIVKGKLPSNQQILTDLRSSIEVKNLSSRIEPLNKEIERLFSPYWQSDYNSLDELELLIEKGDRLHNLICQLEPQLSELINNVKNQTNSVKDELIALIDKFNESITIFDNNWQKFNDLVKAKTDIISPQEEDFITQIKRLLNQLSTAQRDFQNWCRYQKTIKELEDKQLESFVKAHQKGEIEVDKLAKVLRKSILYPWFVKYFDSQSILRNFDGNEQRKYIHKFNKLYKQYLKLNQQVIKSELCQNLPSGAVVFEGSEVGVLKRENEKQKAHIPVRALLQKIPNLLPKLKPCLLMSPASVAHFLPADGNPFDLVVIEDNISQAINDLVNNISFQNNQVSQNSEISNTDEKKENQNTEISHDSVQTNSTPFISYEKANLEVVTEDKQLIYNNESIPLIKQKIIQLVEIEAPILLSDVVRPVAQCWSYNSVSKKLNQHLTTILNELIKEERIYLDDDFLWNNQSQCQKWDKARKNDDENKRKIEQISLQELAVIAEWIIHQSLSIDEEGLMREMANHLDFKQLTQGVKTRLEQTIKYVEERGNVKLEGGRIIWN